MNVPATRMELLKLRARKKLAQKGHSLLKRKRDVLIRRFFEYINEYKEVRKKALESLEEARNILHVAQGVSGVNRVKGIALSMKPGLAVEKTTKNLMGVKVTSINLDVKENGKNASFIGTSYHVQDALNQFKSVVPELVKLAEIESVIFTLAEEIKKTKRRVNALEFVKIPELNETEKHVKTQLAEIERESFGRLKNVKKKLENEAHS